MLFVCIVEIAVCVLILTWLLKSKTGEPFSKKTVIRFLGFGLLALVVNLVIGMILPFDDHMFFSLNPLLSGFLSAFLLAALIEEAFKYLFFRLALVKNQEVNIWLDAVIAAVAVGIGFTIFEDIEYALSGSGNLMRAFLPMHVLFQILMGYFYGKARVTKSVKYHVLSLAAPIAAHTLFDMFVIGLMTVIGDPENLSGLTTPEQLQSLPYYNYLVPLFAGVVVTAVGGLVLMLVLLGRIRKWGRNNEKQEPIRN